MFKRWKKIEEDMIKKRSDDRIEYDMSKLPEICDNIVYDMIHNENFRKDPKRQELLRLAQLLCMAIVPCEYGLSRAQKVKIGISITKKLLEKIHGDLVWWKNQYVMNLLQPIVNSNKEFQYENRQWHD